MKLATACLAAALLLAGCASPSSEEEIEIGPVALMSLPDFYQTDGYRSGPYLRAAVHLQGMGREAATKALWALVREEGLEGHRAIILCRMLFTRRAGGEFRRPRLGGTVFLGDTDYADWPLEPVEVVDGVPFVIVRGYELAGVPETSEDYLAYCVAECDWSGVPFVSKTKSEMVKAMEKLDRSPKWKEPPEAPSPSLAVQVE
jgi:hypothetical protein